MNKYDTNYVENLKSRWADLNKIKIQTETELKSAQAELDKAMNDAKSQFGVTSLDELRDLYGKRVEENNKSIEDFERNLSEIENKLRDL